MSKGKRIQLAVNGGCDEWDPKSHHWSSDPIVQLAYLGGGGSPTCATPENIHKCQEARARLAESSIHTVIGFGGSDCFNRRGSLASAVPNHSHCWTCGADKTISLKH